MSRKIATISVKITREEKELFFETAKEVGLTPSEAIRLFVRAFIEQGGLPFDVPDGPKIKVKVPKLLRAHLDDKGDLVVPDAWRDEDDDDDDYGKD